MDHETFRVYPQEEREDFGPGQVFLYAGRLAVEKTSMRFCSSISLAPKSWWAMVRIAKRLSVPRRGLYGYRHNADLAVYASGDWHGTTALRTRLGW